MLEVVEIYTDGSCIYNPGPGGFASIIKFYNSNNRKIINYGFYYTTNNRMELMAVIFSLKYLFSNINIGIINVFTDSNYIFSGVNLWINLWRKNKWKTSSNKLVKNIDLWLKINNLLLFFQRKINFYLIKSHNGNLYNEKCDKIALFSAKKPSLIDLNYVNNLH